MVELDINHNFIAGEGTLVDDGDWNDTHKISGGGTLRVPQLIEEKTLPPGTTTVTFSGLNGDADKDYLIEHELVISAGGSDRVLYLYPNNVSTNQGYQLGACLDSGTSCSTNTYNCIATNSWSADGVLFGETKIKAITGSIRRFTYFRHFVSSNFSRRHTGYGLGWWNDTSTNITSLVITASGGSFSGTIRLYRMVDLVLE